MTEAVSQSKERVQTSVERRGTMLSIVIPVRDEEDNLGMLLEEVDRALEPREDFEVLVVDDGSRDGTYEALQSLAQRYPRLRVLRHEGGYGQSAAIATGIGAAKGEWIVTLDGDGQNDPADIEVLLDRISGPEPPDMVVGWRRDRNDPWIKRVASKVANGIYRAFLVDPTPDVGCGLKAFRRELFLSLPRFDHMHRFLPALTRRAGGRVESVVVRHRRRRKGRSKYGVVDRLLVGMIDILGVKWLQMRVTRPKWEETEGTDPVSADVSAEAEEKQDSPAEKLHPFATLLLLGLTFFFVFGRLGGLPLLNPDEGRNAEIAREMAISGRWLVPTYNELPYLDKPSFYFKLVGLSLSTFGLGEAAARLPSALFAAALLVLVYGFCRKEYGAKTAALAVAVVSAMPLFIAFSRIVIFDMALSFFVSLAIFAGYRALEREGRGARLYYTLGAAAAGAATLTKGPVGFLLPALVLLVLARVERRRGVLRAMFHPLPLGAFLLMVLPWFLGVSLQRPDFPYYGLVRESFERFTQPTFQRTGPFYYYVPVIAGVCFAWSLLLPDAIPLAWRQRARWKRADRLFVVWAVTVVLFFSLSSSKLPGYVLTSVVALGALVARLFSQALSDPRGSAAKVVFRSAITLSAVSLLIALWLTLELRAPSFRWGLRALDVPDATVRPFVSPLLYTLAAMSGMALVGRFTKKVALVLAAYFLLPISILTFIFSGFESYASYNSSAALAREIRELPPRTTVVCFRCFPTGLGYYLRQTVFLVSNDATEMTSNYIPFYLSREHASPEQIIPLSRLRPWLQTRRLPVLILSSEEGASALRTLAATEGGVLRSFPNDFVGLFIGRRWRSQS